MSGKNDLCSSFSIVIISASTCTHHPPNIDKAIGSLAQKERVMRDTASRDTHSMIDL
jgi:hypothetical protein